MGESREEHLEVDIGTRGLADLISFSASYAGPREQIPFARWAQERIRVPASINPERNGPFSWDGYEFAPHIMESIFAPETRVGVICAPPQFLKTFLATLGILYVADQLGGPQLYVTTTRVKRDEFADQKLQPMILESPELAAKIPLDKSGNRDRKFWNYERICLDGEDIILGQAGSPASLASTTAMVFWGDEPAKWRNDFKGEGGAVGLGKKRVKAFPQTGKVILFSTPPQIIDKDNDFWTEFTQGTLERVFVECLNCGHHAPLAITKHWGLEGDQTKCFYLQHTAKKSAKGIYDLVEVEKTTSCICPNCGTRHSDREKPEMIKRHQWRRGNPSPDPGQVSFWLNRLYQPGVRFGVVLSEWFRACRTERGQMEFLLQEMAQPYRPKTNKVDASLFKHLRRDDYALGTVPKSLDLQTLVITADVQELEIPWTIWAVKDGEAALVNYGLAYELAELSDISKQAEIATDLSLHGAFIDAGHRTREVYRFCSDQPGERWVPVHGRDMQKLVMWSKDLDVERGMKRQSRRPRVIRALLWQNFAWKTELYSGIVQIDKDKAGVEGREASIKLWLPRDIFTHTRFLRQLSAERLEVPKRGRPVWRSFRENHWGDCTCELLVYLETFRGRLSAPARVHLPAPTQGASGW